MVPCKRPQMTKWATKKMRNWNMCDVGQTHASEILLFNIIPVEAQFFFVFFFVLSFRFVFIVIVIDLTHKRRIYSYVCILRVTRKGMFNVLFRDVDQWFNYDDRHWANTPRIKTVFAYLLSFFVFLLMQQLGSGAVCHANHFIMQMYICFSLFNRTHARPAIKTEIVRTI